jgi:pyruvate-formate lyase
MTAIHTTHRLSPLTRELAARALEGEWGRALVDLPLTLDGRDDLKDASDERRYAHCIKLIAEQAPLRVLPGERIIGSATLKQGPMHCVPVYAGGKPAFGSSSHVTLGFDKALAVGYRGLRTQINERLARGDLDERGVDLLESMLICLDAAATWHRRHMELLEERIAASSGDERRTYEQVRDALRNVPENPPTTFHEAVQGLWFLFGFQRLCGNWPGLGRIDQMLGPYLERDLAAGRITLDEARELLAHFWIKGCDWIGAETMFGGSGDGQHYQNVVLGGIDAEGREVTNPVTYLVLDVIEELRIPDFPTTVRISPRTPDRLLQRIAEVQRLGGGTVAVYNEDLIIRALTRFGYSLDEARRFANDGCWEVQVPGKTNFVYHPFDTLLPLQLALGLSRRDERWGERARQIVPGDTCPEYATFDELYAAFGEALAEEVQRIHAIADRHASSGYPTTLVSLLTEDCIERGRGYHDRGARYNVYAPHAGGLADTGNSLLAIKRLVYDERRLTLAELVDNLRRDWEGQEVLRREVLTRFDFYGNDRPEADAMTRRVFDDFLALVGQVRERQGVLRPAGVSTFGREIVWRQHRRASAHGHHARDILATNFSPTPGSDKTGPTAVIKSHCAMDLVRLTNGTALELKLDPSSVRGEEGLQSMIGLLRTFVDLGGIYLQIDVVDNQVLREAQQHPERYATLAVRVAGWSARFVTLDKDWQEMIINRTVQV